MPVEDKLTAVARRWAKELAIDLGKSYNDAIKEHGGKVQESSNPFDVSNIEANKDGVSFQIVANNEYWVFVEKGVKGTGKNLKEGQKQKAPNSPFQYKGEYINTKAVGGVWQGSVGISPQKVLADIQLKVQRKYSRLTQTGQRLSKVKKKPTFKDASKTLSIIFARSIAKQGLVPKPFIDRVLTEERVKLLQKNIADVIGRELIVNLTLNNEFKNVDITV